jgi:hypothetical protein
MTAPVTEQTIENEKIGMTAPVTSTLVEKGERYRISFAMPAKYTTANLPEPVDKQITIQEVKSHRAAVLKFSGYLNEKLALNKAAELEAWLEKNSLKGSSGFLFAQYNPPWTLGPFRRNEIITRLE